MTNEQMRIAIAKVKYPNHKLVKGVGMWSGRNVLIPNEMPDNPYESERDDALEQVIEISSVDLMQEIRALSSEVKQITDGHFGSERDAFINHLESIIEPTTFEEDIYFGCVVSTEDQRAEAYLRTKGLWVVNRGEEEKD